METQLANTSNTIALIEPTDDEIDASPFDYPAQWIARALDSIRVDRVRRPMNMSGLPEFKHETSARFVLAVHAYVNAVVDTDPNPDKSDDARRNYQAQHVVTNIAASEHWDDRTVQQGPITLAVAAGPFYSVALVLRGATLHVQSLGRDGTSVRVA